MQTGAICATCDLYMRGRRSVYWEFWVRPTQLAVIATVYAH